MAKDGPADRLVRIVVKNGTNLPTRLVLKPFSGFYDMAVGASYEVRGYGPSTGTVTLEHVEGGCVVTGWPGCILSAHILKQVGGPRLRSLPQRAMAPTVALLKRMMRLRDEEGDDEETLV